MPAEKTVLSNNKTTKLVADNLDNHHSMDMSAGPDHDLVPGMSTRKPSFGMGRIRPASVVSPGVAALLSVLTSNLVLITPMTDTHNKSCKNVGFMESAIAGKTGPSARVATVSITVLPSDSLVPGGTPNPT